MFIFLSSLNYWSYVFFFFSAASKWICQTSYTFGESSERRKKKSGTMGKRWPSELVWYYILFQSYTITNWNHITAPNWGPDNLLKGQFPERGDLWPQACQQSSAGWLGHGCRGYMQQHIHMDTQSLSFSNLFLSVSISFLPSHKNGCIRLHITCMINYLCTVYLSLKLYIYTTCTIYCLCWAVGFLKVHLILNFNLYL